MCVSWLHTGVLPVARASWYISISPSRTDPFRCIDLFDMHCSYSFNGTKTYFLYVFTYDDIMFKMSLSLQYSDVFFTSLPFLSNIRLVYVIVFCYCVIVFCYWLAIHSFVYDPIANISNEEICLQDFLVILKLLFRNY